MEVAGTSLVGALFLLVLFAFCNWVHSITFYKTLVYFPGGATSAGVMKGLQAVLVFVFTDFAFCGKTGGQDLCFTNSKCVSLVLVVIGVVAYGTSTPSHVGEGYRHIQTEFPTGIAEENRE